MDKITHFEIPVGNMKRAEKFLGSVFGWKFEDWGEDYHHARTTETGKNGMPKEKGAINGGLSKRETRNDRAMPVVSVASIDRTLDKVKKARGKVVVGKTEEGEWGWWAEVMDTEGNTYELWEDK